MACPQLQASPRLPTNAFAPAQEGPLGWHAIVRPGGFAGGGSQVTGLLRRQEQEQNSEDAFSYAAGA